MFMFIVRVHCTIMTIVKLLIWNDDKLKSKQNYTNNIELCTFISNMYIRRYSKIEKVAHIMSDIIIYSIQYIYFFFVYW